VTVAETVLMMTRYPEANPERAAWVGGPILRQE